MEKMDNTYKRKTPFSLPEGYLEGLTDRIVEKVKEEEKPERVKWFVLLKPYAGLAAIFVMALLIVQLVVPRFVDQSRMLQKGGTHTVTAQGEEEAKAEFEFGSEFNPTREEILDYLSAEVQGYEIMAELY